MNNIVIKETPITRIIKEKVLAAENKINIAVPFVSGFVSKIFDSSNNKLEKRILISLDDKNISSYNLKAIKYLIENGFEVRHDNTIHLKLYIIDEFICVSSANLTTNGFEKNVELSVFMEKHNQNIENIFNKLWKKNVKNTITLDYIEENWEKYKILRSKNRKKDKQQSIKEKERKPKIIDELDISLLEEAIFYKENIFYSERNKNIIEANNLRKKRIYEIKNQFSNDIFYVPEGHKRRKNCIFYDFQYGVEYRLAGTGLKEYQFRDVFKHKNFKNILTYIYPELFTNMKWDLKNPVEYEDLSRGIFDFQVKEYKETLPIRLVSFFYPEEFLQIFNLNHLENMCELMGLKTIDGNSGEKFYRYSSFLKEEMEAIPQSNYIKSQMLYALLFTVKLYKSLKEGNSKKEFIRRESKNKRWIKNLIDSGYERLLKLGVLNT